MRPLRLFVIKVLVTFKGGKVEILVNKEKITYCLPKREVFKSSRSDSKIFM